VFAAQERKKERKKGKKAHIVPKQLQFFRFLVLSFYLGNGPGKFLGFYLINWVLTTRLVHCFSWVLATEQRKVGNGPRQFLGFYLIYPFLTTA